MSDTTGHKPISDEVLERVVEIWYQRVDIKVIVELVRELEG